MKDSAFPYRLHEIKLEVTQACPLACVHCSSDSHPHAGDEMKRNECERIIEEAAAMGVSSVVFSGGEPLGWPHLEQVVRRAKQLGLHTSLYTSGAVEEQTSLFRRLADARLERAVFSMYAAQEGEHERITRVRGSYGKLLNAMKIARAMGIRTEVHFVPLKSNYRQLPQIAELATELGATKISVLRFVAQGRGYLLSGEQLSRVQNVELRQMIRDLRSAGYVVRTGSPYSFLLLPDQVDCMAGKDRLTVGPDLRISPCDAFKQIRPSDIGISEEFACLTKVALTDSWKSSPYLCAIRKMLESTPEEPCLSCEARHQCHGGCLAQKVIYYGRLTTKPDPMCLRVKEGLP